MHKVILVDDEIFTRKGLRNLIDWEACGFQVIDEADNGEDALVLIRQLKPDLVITDIRMPVMDGLELIRITKEKEMVQPSFIIISGYDDFSYAQQAVRYGVVDFILKPIDEKVLEPTLRQLNDKLIQEKAARLQREQLYNERMIPLLIKGEMTDEWVEEWASRNGIRPEQEFRYLLIEVNDIHPWREDRLVLEQEAVKQAVRSAVAEQLPFHQKPYIHEHSKRLGFILPTAEFVDAGITIQQFADDLHARLSRQLETPVYVYAGKRIHHLRDLGQSYESAATAALYKFVKQGSVVYDEVQDVTLNYVDLEQTMTRTLIEHIEENDKKTIQRSIDAIFDEFSKNRYAPEAVKLAVHQCVTGVVKVMNRMEIDKAELTALPSMLGWQDMNLTPAELKRLFAVFIYESAEVLTKNRKDSVKGSIQRIKAYIESNYHENISLKNIAGKFYMNPVYLGQLFKKTYGMYFNEFLLHIRVDEAKKLLRQTDLRIYEIAEKVGFNNADYFVTQFEKIENMTPTEYRNKLL